MMQKVLSVGIEPTTLGLLDPRSNQLSYESVVFDFFFPREGGTLPNCVNLCYMNYHLSFPKAHIIEFNSSELEQHRLPADPKSKDTGL